MPGFARREAPEPETGPWWDIPTVGDRAYRDWMRGFTAGLASPDLRQAVEEAGRAVFFLRAGSDALLGHPDEWVAMRESREAFETRAFERAAEGAIRAIEEYRARLVAAAP